MNDLSQFELLLKKSRLIQTMNQRQVLQYEQESEQIGRPLNLFIELETDIQTAKLDMLRLKMKLDQAQRMKNHRLEYEDIAKKIIGYPTREISQRYV
jgi:hypothetical protein